MRYRDQIRALGFELYERLRRIGNTPDEVAARAAAAEARVAVEVEEIRRMREEGKREWRALQDQRHQHELNQLKRQEKQGLSARALRGTYRRLYRRWVRRNG